MSTIAEALEHGSAVPLRTSSTRCEQPCAAPFARWPAAKRSTPLTLTASGHASKQSHMCMRSIN